MAVVAFHAMEQAQNYKNTTMKLAVHNQCKALTKIKLLFDVSRLAAQEPGCKSLAGGV